MHPFDLTGDGVLLTVPAAEDVDGVTAICQDPEIQRWTTIPSPYTRSDAESFIEDYVPKGWAEDRELTWAVRDPGDRQVVGMIGVRFVGSRGELGFLLARGARGTGMMSRAVRLVAARTFGDERLGITHLGWAAYVGNWGSRRVAWAAGFRMEGTVRGALDQRGEQRDAWVGTLVAGDPMRPATPWLDVPTLQGDGVHLRRFIESDADSVVEACNDPVAQHWLGGLPSPYTRETALAYIRDREEEAAAGRGVHWAAARRYGGPAVGSFSLMDLPSHDGGAELGYWVHPAARGSGLATEAVRLLIRHALAPEEAGGLGLRRLTVAHASGNEASRRVIEKAGFRPIGVERAAERIRGGVVVDLCWYDLLLDDLPR